jgi:hypothetical protein
MTNTTPIPAGADLPQGALTDRAMLALLHYEDMLTRRACGDRSDGSVAKARERLIAALAARSGATAAAGVRELSKAVFDYIERTPCGCPTRMREETGKHHSGCPLFGLSIAYAESAPLAAQTETQPASEAVPYGKVLTMLRWARRHYLDDQRLIADENATRRRSETNQEHADRISANMQENEDLRDFLRDIDEALAAIDGATPAQPAPAPGAGKGEL